MPQSIKLAVAAASFAVVANAPAQVVDDDPFGVALFSLTPDGTGGADELQLDEQPIFGTDGNYTTPLGVPVTVASSETFDGTTYEATIVLSTTAASLVPDGATFGGVAPLFLYAAFGTDLATFGTFDGIDVAEPIDVSTLEVTGLLTVDGQEFEVPGGTTLADNPAAGFSLFDYGSGPDPEIFAEILVPDLDGDDDVSDEQVTSMGVAIRYQIPEPTGLALLTAGTLGLIRRR